MMLENQKKEEVWKL